MFKTMQIDAFKEIHAHMGQNDEGTLINRLYMHYFEAEQELIVQQTLHIMDTLCRSPHRNDAKGRMKGRLAILRCSHPMYVWSMQISLDFLPDKFTDSMIQQEEHYRSFVRTVIFNFYASKDNKVWICNLYIWLSHWSSNLCQRVHSLWIPIHIKRPFC